MRIRTMASLLFAGALAVGLSVGLGATAHADPLVPAGTWNEIFLPFDNGHGNTMCVDVPGGTVSSGAPLQLFHCHGYASDGAPQRWHIFCSANIGCAFNGREWKMQNTNSFLCIGFPNGALPSAGARLVQEACNQVLGWRIVAQNTDGTDPLLELEAGFSGLCMAASNTSDNNQTPLVALPCDGSFQDAGQILQLG